MLHQRAHLCAVSAAWFLYFFPGLSVYYAPWWKHWQPSNKAENYNGQECWAPARPVRHRERSWEADRQAGREGGRQGGEATVCQLMMIAWSALHSQLIHSLTHWRTDKQLELRYLLPLWAEHRQLRYVVYRRRQTRVSVRLSVCLSVCGSMCMSLCTWRQRC